MTAIELLQKARDLLADKRRWTRYTYRAYNYEDGLHSYCMVGAMDQANRRALDYCNSTERRRAHEALKDTIKEQYGFTGIVNFNDHPATNHEDVLLVLDKTIFSLEA